jgi:hypothetical protein
MKTTHSPNDPIYDPGKPTLQVYGEALAMEERHNRWHKEHPLEMCPPEFSSMDTYATIQRGENLLGAMTFEAGDALVPRGGK